MPPPIAGDVGIEFSVSRSSHRHVRQTAMNYPKQKHSLRAQVKKSVIKKGVSMN